MYRLPGIDSLLNLTLAFMLYSIIVSTVSIRFVDRFLDGNPLSIKSNSKKIDRKKKEKKRRK